MEKYGKETVDLNEGEQDLRDFLEIDLNDLANYAESTLFKKIFLEGSSEIGVDKVKAVNIIIGDTRLTEKQKIFLTSVFFEMPGPAMARKREIYLAEAAQQN